MARTIDETRALVARMEASIAAGLSTAQAARKEGLSDASFYKLRQTVRKEGPEVKIFDSGEALPPRPKPGPKPWSTRKSALSDKCIVIVTTPSSLKSVLEGVLQ